MFRKRSIAEILRWMLCFGMSSLETKVSKPRSSQLKSIGQQSWPYNQTSWKHVRKHNQRNHRFVFLLLLIAETQILTLWKSLLITNFVTCGVSPSSKHYNTLQGENNKTLTAATTLFSETNDTLRSGRNSVFSCETLNTRTFVRGLHWNLSSFAPTKNRDRSHTRIIGKDVSVAQLSWGDTRRL